MATTSHQFLRLNFVVFGMYCIYSRIRRSSRWYAHYLLPEQWVSKDHTLCNTTETGRNPVEEESRGHLDDKGKGDNEDRLERVLEEKERRGAILLCIVAAEGNLHSDVGDCHCSKRQSIASVLGDEVSEPENTSGGELCPLRASDHVAQREDEGGEDADVEDGEGEKFHETDFVQVEDGLGALPRETNIAKL